MIVNKHIIFALNLFLLININLIAQEYYDVISERGAYNVGFESYWQTDYSRVFIHKNDTLNRPILINIWYPSQGSSNKMIYKDYLEFPENNTRLLTLNTKYKDYNLNYLYQEVFHCKEDSIPGITDTDSFFNRSINVYKNDLPINKKFPLIIYHQGYGATIEDNSVLCEYLASHGYVVVGSSYLRNSYPSLTIDGRKDSVRDIRYLIQHLTTKENIDVSNTALIGHSGGAQASLMFKSNTPNPIKAIALLETTQEMYGLEDPRWNSFVTPVRKGIENIDQSLLGFTEHRAVFKLYDLMTNAERHYITFPNTVKHNDYISQGIYGRIYKNSKNNNSHTKNASLAENLKNYKLVNHYILTFLNSELKQASDFRKMFDKHKTIDFKNSLYEFMPKGDSIYTPNKNSETPTSRLIWHLTFNNKLSSVVDLLKKHYNKKDINPIYDEYFAVSLLAELLSKKKTSEAKQLYLTYIDLGINPERSFIVLSKFALLFKKYEYAATLLKMVLKLNPNNGKAKEALEKLISDTN